MSTDRMRWATGYFSIQAVVALDVVMLLSGLGAATPHVRPALDAFVGIFDGSLVLSSVLLARRFFRAGSRGLAAVFAGNLAIMMGAAVVRGRGLQFSPWMFMVADLYWLHLYLIVLVKHRRDLIRPAG